MVDEARQFGEFEWQTGSDALTNFHTFSRPVPSAISYKLHQDPSGI
jgi:hypothetical protein